MCVDARLPSCHNPCKNAQEGTAISDRTVELLTKLREACEKFVADDNLSINQRADGLDALTDMTAHLMTANSIEQRALVAQRLGAGGAEEVVERLFGKMKEMVN